MRRNRILKKGASYYITCTINRDRPELKPLFVREMLLLTLKQAKKKFRFSLLNFVFVYTHCHFIIKPKRGENLSKIMQWLLGTFAVRYNKRLKIRGKVWFDRFKSEVIEKIEDFVRSFKRVNNNLKKNNINEALENYIFCGIFYFKNKNFEFLDRLPLLLEFLI